MENMFVKSYLLEMQIRSQSPVTVSCRRYIVRYFEKFLKSLETSIEDVTSPILLRNGLRANRGKSKRPQSTKDLKC